MKTTYLITGGAGNLASQLTHELGVPGKQIVLFDTTGQPSVPVASGCRFVRGDVTSRREIREVLESTRPDTILHMASLLSGSSEQDLPRAWNVNLHSTMMILETMVELDIERILFPSSVATYGGMLPDRLPEDHPQWPTTFYGFTKLACERLGVYFHDQHGVDFRALRLPIVLSAYTPPGAASAYASRAFIDAVRTGGYTFRVAPSSRAACVYIKDALRALTGLLQAPVSNLTRQVYNIHAIAPSAEEIRTTVVDRVAGADIKFEPEPSMVALVEGWPAAIDDQAARNDWNWTPSYNLDRLADAFVADLQAFSPAKAASNTR